MHPTAVFSTLALVLAGLTVADKQDDNQHKKISPAECRMACREFAIYASGCAHADKWCLRDNELSITQHAEWCFETTKSCTDLSLRDVDPEHQGLAKELEQFSRDQGWFVHPEHHSLEKELEHFSHDQPWCVTVVTLVPKDFIPATLKARAMATLNPWDDLGPVTFRTERPETAISEIDPRSAESATTTTTTGTKTMTSLTFSITTEEVEVQSTIIITSLETTPTSIVAPSSETSTVTPNVVVVPLEATPATVAATPIATSTVTSSTTITSAPTGNPMTTISNLRPGLNTVQVPTPSEAPVVVISVPSDSYSSGYTTETLWSSVWEPRNTPISTVIRPVAFYVPRSDPDQAPASTGKSSGASTARSGAGVIVMAGVGALAACFMMF